MVVFETEYGNFGNPEDLLQYMREEGIEKVRVTAFFCSQPAGLKAFEMDVPMIEKWIHMKEE